MSNNDKTNNQGQEWTVKVEERGGSMNIEVKRLVPFCFCNVIYWTLYFKRLDQLRLAQPMRRWRHHVPVRPLLHSLPHLLECKTPWPKRLGVLLALLLLQPNRCVSAEAESKREVLDWRQRLRGLRKLFLKEIKFLLVIWIYFRFVPASVIVASTARLPQKSRLPTTKVPSGISRWWGGNSRSPMEIEVTMPLKSKSSWNLFMT